MSLDEDQVDVIIDLHPDRVHLKSGDLEIGDWAADECAIAPLGDGAYVITAENQSLRFVPHNPGLFEDGLNHGTGYGLAPAPDHGATDHPHGRHTRTLPPQAGPVNEASAPPPRPLTLALFYALAAVTAALGVWALLAII